MGRILFALFIIMPLVEIAFFVIIGNAIGLWPTLAGVVVMGLAGALILRHQGLAVVNEIRGTMARGLLPARALADAMMVGFAGMLLLTPGYFSDILGLLLLLPPVRGALYGFLRSRIRVVAPVAPGYGPDPRLPPDGTIDLDADDWRRH